MGSPAERGRRAERAEPARPAASTDGGRRAPTGLDPRVAYRAVLLALGLLAVGLLFEELVQIVMLVIVAVVLAVPLAASASWMQRWHIPRAVGAVASLLAAAAVAGALLAFVVPTFVSQVNDFVAQLPSTITHLEHSVNHLLGLRRGATSQAVERFVHRYTHHPTVLLGPLETIGVSIVTVVGAIVVVIISALYMAINPDPLVNGLVRLFSPPRQPDVRRTLERIRVAWLSWLRGVALDMVVLGGLLFIGMQIIGLRFAAGFAIFSALMTVIPNYGSVISAAPPIAYGLTSSFREGVLVAVVYVVVNQVEGNVALPLIMGRSVSLHPAVIAIGVLVAGSLFGVVGLVISVPLISLTLILADELWVKPHGSARGPLGKPGAEGT
jgi:predicted PurR-regulated permease PerM